MDSALVAVEAEVPAAAEALAGDRRPRGSPLHTLEVEGGIIRYYDADSRFTAECCNPAHGRCLVTRYVRPRAKMKGRPLGFLKAWLEAAPLCEDVGEHWRLIPDLERDVEFRTSARIRLLESDMGKAMMGCERDSGTGFEKEPAGP